MSTLTRATRRLHADRRAVTAVEYGLMAAFIAAALVAAIVFETGALTTVFADFGGHIATGK